jgi:transcriptional regulator with XRE-family HTH domain
LNIEPLQPRKREWMRELRGSKGLKTREIAPLLNISFQHYNDIERGARNPSFELAYDLAKFFNVPLEMFFIDRTKFRRDERK